MDPKDRWLRKQRDKKGKQIKREGKLTKLPPPNKPSEYEVKCLKSGFKIAKATLKASLKSSLKEGGWQSTIIGGPINPELIDIAGIPLPIQFKSEIQAIWSPSKDSGPVIDDVINVEMRADERSNEIMVRFTTRRGTYETLWSQIENLHPQLRDQILDIIGNPDMPATKRLPKQLTTRSQVLVKYINQVAALWQQPMSSWRLWTEVNERIQRDQIIDPETGVLLHLEDEMSFKTFLQWMASKGLLMRREYENREGMYWQTKNEVNTWGEEAKDPKSEDRSDDWSIPAKQESRLKDNPDGTSEMEDEKVEELPNTKTIGELQKLQVRVKNLESQVHHLEKTRKVEFTFVEDGKKVVIKDQVHELFPEVLFQIKCGYHVMLVGPSGCGKSELAHGLAKHLKLEYGELHWSGGITEAKVYGRNVPNISTGKSTYQPSRFVEIWEKGGVFLHDEVDAGDPNVLLSLNGPLSSKRMSVDRVKDSIIPQHKDFVCIAAANTWGNGADRQYVGRNQLDGAFIKRFVCLDMDYDTHLEFQLCPGKEDFVDRMHLYRARMRQNNIQRVLDTRFIVRGYNWLKHKKDDDYVDSMLFKGWREDEIRKVRS